MSTQMPSHSIDVSSTILSLFNDAADNLSAVKAELGEHKKHLDRLAREVELLTELYELVTGGDCIPGRPVKAPRMPAEGS